ncbi:hypothetical protein IFM89_037682 [Coptis chinensis]|uniref:Glycosyltransferase n=1 Tax=Coptis chinensis TaxID=261450 RepID=A0A835M8F9_9MAGN|nr:hypothetical protein IFM89_037682 [Coptis chinensis]
MTIDELAIDSSLVQGNKSISDFHNVLDKAYWHRIQGWIRKEKEKVLLSSSPTLSALEEDEETELAKYKENKKPKLVILSRDRTTELAKIYRVLNSTDAMVGVHGAAMTHFLFMRPSSVLIQIIPLGTDWAAETYYGEPSRKFGLKYIGYKILPKESSLYNKYNSDDPILNDPDSINANGWQFTKKIYLDGQNVKLDLERFREQLFHAYVYTISERSRGLS